MGLGSFCMRTIGLDKSLSAVTGINVLLGSLGSTHLGWGFLEGCGLQDFGRSVACIPLLLQGDVLLHLIDVTAHTKSH